MSRGDYPKAFFSYVRHVDEHDGGRLSRLRERLQGEIRVQTGAQIEIFQDIGELKWGDRWEQRILSAAAGSLFLIPVVTPGYFLSDPCRREYEAFKALQHTQGVDGVILPIYYVETDELSDPAWREGNAWAEEFAATQWVDWRGLRLEPWESPEPNRRVEQMARTFKLRLKELGLLQPQSPASPGASRNSTQPASKAPPAAPNPAPITVSVATESLQGPRSLPTRREIVVDANGKGHFSNIADAIRVAGPDDILLIRPGVYAESLTIHTSLTVMGDGPLEQIVIESGSGAPIAFRAPFGRIVNLTIRRKAGEATDHAVEIRTGRLELEGCDISSESLSGIGVYGDSDPTLRRNRIHDSSQAGILASGQSRGTIEDNDISNSGYGGLVISGNANPSVRKNRIHGAKSSGVRVYENGRGLIEDNDIFDNGAAGISVKENGNPTVRLNRIHRNNYEGIWIYEGGRGTFEANDLRHNTRGAWDVAPGCVPNVTRSGNIEK
jgi:F-box protein 11